MIKAPISGSVAWVGIVPILQKTLSDISSRPGRLRHDDNIEALVIRIGFRLKGSIRATIIRDTIRDTIRVLYGTII